LFFSLQAFALLVAVVSAKPLDKADDSRVVEINGNAKRNEKRGIGHGYGGFGSSGLGYDGLSGGYNGYNGYTGNNGEWCETGRLCEFVRF
jgi:hypothetical protein